MLRGIEHRIESLFEGIFGRAFRSHVQPVEIARKLVKEMDDHRSVSISRIYVPNEYALYLAPRDREQFRGYEASLLVELADYLAEHARREGYTLLSPPRVLLEEDEDLAVGEFGIATRLVQAPQLAGQPPVAPVPANMPPPAVPAPNPPVVAPQPDGVADPVAEAGPTHVEEPIPPLIAPPVDPGGTRVFEPAQPDPAAAELTGIVPVPVPPPAPPRALLMSGAHRFEIAGGVAVLGRTKDCEIAIPDDASISRRHAEIRPDTGSFWIADLGSTNGTEVNGKRISRLELHSGDRITIGQTTLVFEQLT